MASSAQDSVPVREAQTKLRELVERSRTTGQPITLSDDDGDCAVLMTKRQYAELQEQIRFMRDAAVGLSDVAAGRTSSWDDLREDLLARLETTADTRAEPA